MGPSCDQQSFRMAAPVVILLNLFVLSLAPPVVDQEPSTATSSEDGTGNQHGGQPQPGGWHWHRPQGGFGGMPSSGGMPGYGGPQVGLWSCPARRSSSNAFAFLRSTSAGFLAAA